MELIFIYFMHINSFILTIPLLFKSKSIAQIFWQFSVDMGKKFFVKNLHVVMRRSAILWVTEWCLKNWVEYTMQERSGIMLVSLNITFPWNQQKKMKCDKINFHWKFKFVTLRLLIKILANLFYMCWVALWIRHYCFFIINFMFLKGQITGKP